MFTHSIRWRLQLWLAFLLVSVLSGFGVTVYQLHRINQFNQIDDELNHRVAELSNAIRRPPGQGPPPFGGRRGRPPDFGDGRGGPGRGGFGRGGFERGGGPGRQDFDGGSPEMRALRPLRDFRVLPQVQALFDETETNGYYFAVWSWDDVLIRKTTNAPAEISLPPRIPGSKKPKVRTPPGFREIYRFTEAGDCVLAGRWIGSELKSLRGFAYLLLAAGGAVLVLGLGGGWWLASRAIRPVEEISAAANRISAGNLSERIAVTEPDNELGRLAGVLNSTFARLEDAFAQQKQFTADASHELRTPLAVLISEAQTTLARPRSAAEYRETIEACLDTAQQMRRLTESLLELARLDAGQEQIERSPLDLAELARAAVERIRPLARERGIEIYGDFASAPTSGNADRLGQIVTNFLANAIHYNRPNGEIRVRTSSEEGNAIVTVADTGQGIEAEDLPHIFERFYRADKSRSRAEGRSGLGLAISKAIIEAHDGSIEVSSQAGVGTTFTVRLPAG